MAKFDTWPKISVITPSFNQGRFIARTINSVLDQAYPNLEYIIIDGQSTDETLTVVKKYADRLKWISEPDQGQSDAINKGLRISSGDILCYLNSDDVLLPGSLQAVAESFNQHQAAEWLTGFCRNIDAHDVTVQSPITAYKNFHLRHYHQWSLVMINYISQMSTFWRRTAMDSIGMFDVNRHLVMDYDYWLRLAKRNRPIILRQELAAFRQHDGSKSTNSLIRHFRESAQLAAAQTGNPLLKMLSYAHHYAVIVAYRLFRLR